MYICMYVCIYYYIIYYVLYILCICICIVHWAWLILLGEAKSPGKLWMFMVDISMVHGF